MKIIHLVLGKANPNRMNGVNKVVHQLALNQSNLGHEVSVWGITNTPDDRSEIPDRNFKTELFQAQGRWGVDSKIEQAISQLNGDSVFHLHGGFIPEYYHVHKLLDKYSQPYVFTAHGSYNVKALEKSKWKKQAYFHLFDSKVLKKSKAIHCIGQSELDSSNQLLPNAKKVLIPNGQDLSEMNFNYQEMAEKPSIVFGFCGRLRSYVKGLDLLLDGYAQYVQTSVIESALWLIGDGESMEELQAKSKALNIADQVKFWGAKYGEEKLNLIANSTAFYHPSRYEGLPTAVLEAAALKVPCVVSHATNMAQFISNHKAGISLAKNDAKHIATSMHQIQKWKENNQLNAYGQNAKNMVETAFDWQKIAADLIDVYAS